MLKATWTRLGSPAWLAVGLVILVPALAEAQLFPNRTIRREKPNCASEPPFYKQVRRDYFGYYPTCWSRFPAGWACPCPDTELQSMRAAYGNNPDINRKPGNGGGRFGDEDSETGEKNPDMPPNSGERNDLPLPPGGASPFETDPKPANPPNPPPPGRNTGPGNSGANLPPSSASPSNLELPSLPATSPTSSNEPAAGPGSIAMYPDDATLTSNNSSLRPDLGPLPTAPTPAPFTPENGSTTVSVSTSTDGETVLGTPAPTQPPAAQAPKRRSLLSQLFNRNSNTTQNR
jgi:hypothetical protein